MHQGYREDNNTYNRTKYDVPIQTGTDQIPSGNLIVANSSYYKPLKLGTAFDITYPILYANSYIAANSGGTDNYLAISFAITNTQNINLTMYEPVFIKGTLDGVIFTPISTTPLTQTIPTV